jgi:hypothetical protein
MALTHPPMGLSQTIKGLGTLRILLALATCFLIALAPFAKAADYQSGWDIFRGIVAPALAVPMMFVLLVDLLMSWIFLSSVDAGEQPRYKAIIRLECLLFAILSSVWIPMILWLVGYFG